MAKVVIREHRTTRIAETPARGKDRIGPRPNGVGESVPGESLTRLGFHGAIVQSRQTFQLIAHLVAEPSDRDGGPAYTSQQKC